RVAATLTASRAIDIGRPLTQIDRGLEEALFEIRRVDDVLTRLEGRIRIARKIKLQRLIGADAVGVALREQRLEVRDDDGIDDDSARGCQLRDVLLEHRVDFLEIRQAGLGRVPDRFAQDSDARAFQAVAIEKASVAAVVFSNAGRG